MKRPGFIKYWLPVLGWMLVIAVASTDLLSGERSSQFIGPFLRWLVPGISAATIATAQLLVRKAAHVAEYAILAALVFRALREQKGNFSWSIASLVVAAASACAALDEFHQTFVAARTGSPWDVLIDICGAVLGLVMYWILSRRQRNRQTEVDLG